MATKWKNIISISRTFLKRYRSICIGGIFTIAGLALFYHILFQISTLLVTRDTWFVGSIANILLGIGVALSLKAILRIVYQNWTPQDENFYDEWRREWRKQQLILLAIAVVAFVAAFGYFKYQRAMFYLYGNYSVGYLMMATVFIQYGLSQFCIITFMKGRLNLLMERMTEINRESLAAAIEIERKSLEKVTRSEQLKVDLISNVSHDLKTPLTSMVGYIELLKKEALNDIGRDYVEVISDKAEKLKEMIESLFSLAKASSGNIELHMEPIDLNRLIEQIFADMEDHIKNSDLQFVTLLTEEKTGINTDNIYMYRICQNLIENALKYSASGTRVFVKTFVETGSNPLDKEKVCLEITNTAGYFMDFQKEDIIERFARSDRARTSEGNGLGLAIVSTYTSALGGAFDISIDCDQFKARLAFERESK